ncbi:addiction module protein [bacterium]|nr:addiction module protein [bacterium]MBU1753831.1 addiction module protein [bacterium]
MQKTTVTDMLSLSIPERIVLVEDLWDSIAAKAEVIELTDKEKQIIDQRIEAYHCNPNAASPWNEVYKRIVKNYEV